MKRLTQTILILGFLSASFASGTGQRLFWGVEDSLCGATLAEQTSKHTALSLYHELLSTNLVASPETRIEAYRRFTSLRRSLESASSPNGAPLPEFAADDLYGSLLRVEDYRERRDAILRQTQERFATLRDGFPRTFSADKVQSNLVWRELLRLVNAAPNATEVTLFDDHVAYAVYDSSDMRSAADQVAQAKLMVAPPEILLWVETIHGLMVLEKSGVLKDTSDIKNLRLRWTHSLLESFDKSLQITSQCRLMHELLLDFGPEFENLRELRHTILTQVMASSSESMLEVQQHFLSLLLIEDTRTSNLSPLQARWTEALVTRDSTILKDALAEFPRLEDEMARILNASREQLRKTHRGKLPNLLWSRQGLAFAEARIKAILEAD
ncbi:MAG: hypothetical protein KDD51_08630 [Bdellovibrionales bacterium]|nr:hypothetical protein [Bdellovibrionales bacterium]